MGPQGPTGLAGPRGPEGASAEAEPLVVAHSGSQAATTTELELPLSGSTEWSQPAGKVGLLMVQASATLATDAETTYPEPSEECSPRVRVLDNGERVGSAAFFVYSDSTEHAATLCTTSPRFTSGNPRQGARPGRRSTSSRP